MCLVRPNKSGEFFLIVPSLLKPVGIIQRGTLHWEDDCCRSAFASHFRRQTAADSLCAEPLLELRWNKYSSVLTYSIHSAKTSSLTSLWGSFHTYPVWFGLFGLVWKLSINLWFGLYDQTEAPLKGGSWSCSGETLGSLSVVLYDRRYVIFKLNCY